jgi:hypothetical protein
MSDIYYEGGVSYTVQRAFTNVAASSTDGAFVTAVASQSVRVLGAVISAVGAATVVTFNSKPSGAGTAISATFTVPVSTSGWVTLPYVRDGWFQSNSGEGLTVTTGSGSTLGIQIIYVVIT